MQAIINGAIFDAVLTALQWSRDNSGSEKLKTVP